MQNYKKVTSTILLLLIMLLTVVLSFFVGSICYAYTNDVVINLDDTSDYAVYNGNFAYTNSNNLFMTADNTIISKSSAFVGNLIDMSINDEYIVLLSKNNSNTTLTVYRYFDKSINKFCNPLIIKTLDLDAQSLDQTTINTITKLSMYDNTFYISSNTFIKPLNFNSGSADINFIGDYSAFDNFFVYSVTDIKHVVYQSNGMLYDNSNAHSINSTQLFDSSNVLSFVMYNDLIYANTTHGVYKIDPTTNSSTKLSSEPTLPLGKIQVSSISTNTYVYMLDSSNKAIKMYILKNDSLEYLNSFDSTIYQHPQTYSLIKTAVLTKNQDMIVSPKNRTAVKSYSANDKLLVLSMQDNFYYVTDGKGNFGYLSMSNLYFVENGKLSEYDNNCQALHNDTKIYQFPFKQSTQLHTIDVFKVLAITDFIGVKDDKSLWGWCRVSFVDDNNITQSGYLPLSDIAPYTNYDPPSVYRQAKIKAANLGDTIYAYLLPDQTSQIILELTDGQTINLAQKFNSQSEWTKIQLENGEGYILTRYLQPQGLTAWQITLITVCCVIFVAMLTTFIIIMIKKKKAERPY